MEKREEEGRGSRRGRGGEGRKKRVGERKGREERRREVRRGESTGGEKRVSRRGGLSRILLYCFLLSLPFTDVAETQIIYSQRVPT